MYNNLISTINERQYCSHFAAVSKKNDLHLSVSTSTEAFIYFVTFVSRLSNWYQHTETNINFVNLKSEVSKLGLND